MFQKIISVGFAQKFSSRINFPRFQIPILNCIIELSYWEFYLMSLWFSAFWRFWCSRFHLLLFFYFFCFTGSRLNLNCLLLVHVTVKSKLTPILYASALLYHHNIGKVCCEFLTRFDWILRSFTLNVHGHLIAVASGLRWECTKGHFSSRSMTQSILFKIVAGMIQCTNPICSCVSW